MASSIHSSLSGNARFASHYRSQQLKRNSRRRRLLMELLEDRRLLAVDNGVTYFPSSGLLDIRGDDNANSIQLSIDPSNPSQVHVQVDNRPAATMPAHAIGEIQIQGLGGDDTLIVDVSQGQIPLLSRIHFDGGSGTNDRVVVRDTSGRTQLSGAVQPVNREAAISRIFIGPYPATVVSFQHVEHAINQLGNLNQEILAPIVATGDAATVYVPGADGQPFTGANFSAVLGFGQYPLDVSVQANTDWRLTYQGKPVATLPRFGGSTFATDGGFLLAPSARNDALPFDTSADLGLQGTLRLDYQVGGVTKSISVQLVSGLSPFTFDGYDAGSPTAISRVQQRLNYLGFTDLANQPLAVDGAIGLPTDEAIQKFKAAATNPAGSADSQSTALDAATVARLNGLGAAYTGLTNGQLSVLGDNNANTIQVSLFSTDRSMLQVQVDSQAAVVVPLAAVTQLDVRGMGGDDTLIVDVSLGQIPLLNRIEFDGGVGGYDRVIVRDTTGRTSITGAVQPVNRESAIGRIFLGPGPQTVISYQHVEQATDQLGNHNAAIVAPLIASGDAGTVYVPGPDGQLFTSAQFAAVFAGTLFPLDVTIDANLDWRLMYQGKPVATLPRFADSAFNTEGGFIVAPSTADDALPFDTSTEHGWQGTLRISYIVGGAPMSIDAQVIAGVNPFTYHAYTDDSPTDVARVQQRLSYFGYSDSGGQPLAIDGTRNAQTDQALQKFKAAGTNPPGDVASQTTTLDATTVARLNGQGVTDPGLAAGCLSVLGDTNANEVTVSLDGNDHSLLRVQVDNRAATLVSLATISQIDVQGFEGDDTLVVDVSQGQIPLQNRLHFDGGSGTNDRVIVRDTSGRTQLTGAVQPVSREAAISRIFIGPHPATVLSYQHAEHAINQLGGIEQEIVAPIVATGDVATVYVPGPADQTFTNATFSAVAGNTVYPLDVSVQANTDWQLNYQGKPVARLIRFGGPTFATDGGFLLAPVTHDDSLPFDNSTLRGLQGALRVSYLVGGVPQSLDVQLISGLSPFTYQGYVDDNPTAIARVQQRLNYLGYSDDDGQRLIVDGTVNVETNAALKKFKADATIPPTTPDSESATLDELTITRLNGLGLNSALVADQTLTILANEQDNQIRLSIDANNSSRLRVDIDQQPASYFARSTFDAITVSALGGNDKLFIDTSRGQFSSSKEINFVGGAGQDQLLLSDTTGRSSIVNLTPPDADGSGRVILTPHPGTFVDYVGVETIVNQIAGSASAVDRRLIATGDASLVRLAGSAGDKYTLDSFEVVQGNQAFPLVVKRDALRGDYALTYQGKTVATLIFSDRLEPSIPFSDVGVFAFAASAVESNLPFDTAAEQGFQGIVRIHYRSGQTARTIDVESVPGFWSEYTFPTTDQFFRTMVLQQRLNYFSATDFAGSSLNVDGILGPLVEEAIRNFKGQLSGNALAETADLDAVTLARLNQNPANGLALLPDQQANIATSFDALATRLLAIDSTGPMGQPLPIVGSIDADEIELDPLKAITIGNTLSPGSRIGNQVVLQLGTYIQVDDTPTSAEFFDFIQSTPAAAGFSNLEFDLQPNELSINIGFNASVVSQHQVDMGSEARANRLSIDPTPTIDLATQLTSTLRVGYDFTNADINRAAYFQIESATLSASATFADTVNLHAGFLDLPGSQASFLIDSNVQLFGVNGDGPNARLTLYDFLTTPSASLFATNSTGTAGGSLTPPTNVFGASVNGSIALGGEPNSLFSGIAPSIDLSGLGGLRQLMTVEPTQLGAAVSQLGTLLQNLRTSSLLGDRVKFTDSAKLGDVIDPAKLVNDTIGSLFVTTEKQPAVKTLQELVTRLGSSLDGGSFNTATKILSLYLKLAGPSAAQKVRLGFENGLGDLTNLATASDGDLSGTTAIEFTLAFDLSQPVGGGVTFTAATPLADLNAGRGVIGLDVDGKPDLLFTLSSGVAFEVTLDGATTLGDVLTRVNAAVPVAVGALLEARIEKDHLVFVDRTQGDVGGFSIKGINGSLVGLGGVGLGILANNDKPDSEGNFTIEGVALHGDTLSNHAFLVATGANVPKLSGTTSLTAADVDARSNLNLVPLTLGNGSTAAPAGTGASSETFNASFKDPNNDGKLTFNELQQGIKNTSAIADPAVLGGSSNFSLPASAVLLGETVSANPGITISWTDLSDPNAFSVDYGPALQPLRELGAINQSTINDLLEQVADYLDQVEQLPFFQDKIPLLNESLGGLVGAAKKFREAMDDFGDDAIDSLLSLEEKLETAVEKALSIPVTPGDGPTVELSRDGHALRVEINYNPTFAAQRHLNLDLDALGIPGVSTLVDARGMALFDVSAGANFDLDLGIDLTNPNDPRPFLYNTTAAALSAKIYGSNIHFTAAVGPLGISIGNGSNNNGFLVLDSDGLLEATANPADRAALTVGLTGGAGDRIYFDNFGANNLSAPTILGQMNLQLPIYKKDNITVLDAAKPNLAWQFSLNNLDSPPLPSSVPNFTAIFDALRLDGALDGFNDGWDTFFDVLDTALDSTAYLAKLPLIGDQLKDAASFITDLRERVKNNFDQAGELTTDVLRQKIYEAVGPGGLNWLQDRNGNGVQIDDVVLSPGVVNVGTDEIRIDMTLMQTATLVNEPIDFDLGLPLVGLDLDGGVQVKAGFTWNFGFGISKTQGFFLATAAKDELKINIDATTPNLHAKGTLGFFQVDASDDPAAPSRVSGQIAVDLKDPSGDGRLTLGELTSAASFSQIVDARFTGDADINLKLVASFGGNAAFPSIGADFNLDWHFLNASTAAAENNFGGAPQLALNHLTIDAGQAISKMLAPILDTINDTLGPVKPVIDLLGTPLPVVSDLLGSSFTLLDVAAIFNPDEADEILLAKRFISVAKQLTDLADSAKSLGTAKIDVGSFNLTGNGGVGGLDVRNRALATLNRADLSGISGILDSIPLDDIPGASDVAVFLSSAASIGGGADGVGSDDGGFSFPILDNPLSIVQALLGGNPEDIVFFAFETPKLEVSAALKVDIPIFPPFLTAFVGGGIEVDGQLGFGFDASGMARFVESNDTADIFDGFYVSDRLNADGTGPDVDELTLTGAIEVGAFAGVDLGAVDIEAGAKGGIYANVSLNLNDPNNSGRIHPSEFAELADQGFECLVDLHGEVKAGASIYVDVEALTVTVFSDEFEIASVTLVEFNHHCTAANNPQLGSLDNGVLTLLFDQASDDDFRITGGEEGSIIVKARGKQQIFNGVTSIVGDAGGGNDSIQISATIALPVELFGGDGNDFFNLGGGAATIHGGAGNDTIDASSAGGIVVAFGDDGDDVLIGGRADDDLHGGLGRDQLRGGMGNDKLYGDEGDDELTGGSGNDTLDGGDGNDKLYGETGNDLLEGGKGDDYADGGTGDDEIHGDDGDDKLIGGDGVDHMYGGAGNDFLDGGLANDYLEGNDGDDYLDGGRHNDTIYGGAGNDVILGGLGSDTLYGEAGNDRIIAGLSEVGGDPNSVHFIDAGEGSDVVYGDIGPDVIFGGSGDDRLFGLAGNDTIDAGLGNDIIYGGLGSDRIVGGWGRDAIYAGTSATGGGSTSDKNTLYGDAESGSAAGAVTDEADTIYGDVGDDTIYAGVGDDTVYALAGSDYIEGGLGSDLIYGGVNELGGGAASDANTIYGDSKSGSDGQADRIYGDIGPDTVYAGAGNDTVYTLAGNDIVYAGGGNDAVETAAGDDIVYGEEGDDDIRTGTGSDLVFGGGDDDRIDAGDDDDFVVGGTGNDVIDGGAGSDVLWGGSEVISATDFSRSPSALSFPTNFPDAVWSITSGMKRLAPSILAGLSVEGQANDGDDRISGGSGTDWIFGGGGNDDLDGGNDDDYVDGGSGHDAVRGGSGDDVLRGGSGDDVLRGGDGIDQLFGDAGTDHLFGDAGKIDGALADSLTGQRLFGGEGIDYLYAFSYTINVAAEKDLLGDELHGGTGGDWLYGSIRSETLYGDAGNETIEGDAVIGPNYAPHSERSILGGNDTIYGGSGEDKLYGGGGDDTIWGGFDSDWLEGQNGVDKLYGGSGIDILVLDTSFGYDTIPDGQSESFDGHFGNIAKGDTPDDNATDILQIEGSDAADTIRLGQVRYTYNHPDGSKRFDATKLAISLAAGGVSRFFTADWRDFFDKQDANGKPLVEQFRIAGLGGDDELGFIAENTSLLVDSGQIVTIGGVKTDLDPLDVGDLDDRSDDFIGVLDGGPGNDTLRGTNARDRLDGGFGSDTLYGYAGDDQLWGDGGPGFGLPTDFDRIFGGQGNDDLLGGQGQNELVVWSYHPDKGFGDLQFDDGQTATGVSEFPRLIGRLPLPIHGRLEHDAKFKLSLTGYDPFLLVIPVDQTNQTRQDLIDDVNAVIIAADLDGLVTAALDGDRIELVAHTDTVTINRVDDFGVFIDTMGALQSDSGDHAGAFDADGNPIPNGLLDVDDVITGPKRAAYRPEDTGLNRVLGGGNVGVEYGGDELYGGTGLDFLYGNEGPASDPDRLYDRSGDLFESLDGGLAGDEWKDYARSTNKVWYYGGTNLNDVISVDFVTEPGVLQGHHLITRLTENNGNFTFDAQVRLDFGARNANGKLIWSPNDSYYGSALTGASAVPDQGRLVDADGLPLENAEFAIAVDGLVTMITLPSSETLDNQSLLDLASDLNKALGVVGLSTMLSARPNGDRISFVRVGSQVTSLGSLIVVSANATAEQALGLTTGLEATIGFVGSHGLQSLLPPEDDFAAIIIDALDGNDQITVGPTVVKTVWTDAGAGDDRVIYVSGKPILIDKTDSRDNGIGNGDIDHAFDFDKIVGERLITGLTIDSPTDHDWYKFRFSTVPGAGEEIRVRSISSSDRLTAILYDQDGDLVPGGDLVDGVIDLRAISGLLADTDYFLEVFTNLIPTVYEIEFVTGAAANIDQAMAAAISAPLDQFNSIQGRALRTGQDSAWYSFQLSRDVVAGDELLVNIFEATGPATITIYDSLKLTDPIVVPAHAVAERSGIAGDSVSIPLTGLKKQITYWIEISGEGPTRYELVPRMGGSLSFDLSQRAVTDLSDPILTVRKDVIFGGTGDDVIQGGPGEDWIFGGPGNDVLSGGYDRQKGDLIWGGAGDDIYQILPDGQALTRAGTRSITIDGQTTFIPTYSDRFDGGDGNDQVLFLGGDLDAQGDPVADNVAIRWNTILHCYEFTSRVWDVVQNDFVAESYPGAAVYTGSAPASTMGLTDQEKAEIFAGRLSADAVFDVTVNGGLTKTITVAKDSTKFNALFTQLATQLNAAIAEQGLATDLVAEVRNGRIAFSTLRIGASAELSVSSAADSVAASIGITSTMEAKRGGDTVPSFAQQYAYYTTLRTESTVIETRAGNDEVHADPGYLIRGSEWGIDPEDRPQRANPNLIIRGGAGSDRLFGGAGDDTIEGGDDADVIVGGGGNDDLSGNFGDDWIAGGTPALVPDRYEFASGYSNDIVAHASLLTDSLLPLQGLVPTDVVLGDLNLHYGDRGDWYVLKTPEALKSFGSAKAANVLRSMIGLQFTGAEASTDGTPVRRVLAEYGYQTSSAPNDPGRTLFLFAATDTDPGSGLSPVSIEEFAGVPDLYLIHVVNVNSFALVTSAPLTTPAEYNFDTGSAIPVGANTGSIFFSIDGGSPVEVQLKKGSGRSFNGATNSVLQHLRDQINNKLFTGIYGNTESLGNYIYVDQISQQDQRVGFWLRGNGGTKLQITGVAGAAATLLHLGTGQVSLLDPTIGRPPEAIGPYSLTFKADALTTVGIGSTVHVSGATADVRLQSSDASYRPVAIPLGNINGDAYDDFIGFVQESGPDAWLAKVYFGGPDVSSPDFASPDLLLQLPFRFSSLALDDAVIAGAIATGDFNGDGIGDVAFTDGDYSVQSGEPSGQVRIVLGRRTWPAYLNVAFEADVNVTGLSKSYYPSNIALRISSAGDLNGDGTDDLLIGDRYATQNGTIYVLLGDSYLNATGWRVWADEPSLANIDFEGGNLDGFVLSDKATYNGVSYTGTADQNLWHVSDRRAADVGHSPLHSLYFGDEATGNYNLPVGGPSQRVLGRAYYSLDLTDVPVGADISLSLNYFLQTEGSLGLYDRAIVNVSSDFTNASVPITTLYSNQSTLVDPSGTWRNIQAKLGQFQGTQIQLAFDFDSVDGLINNFEGFYVDDVQLRIRSIQIDAANLARIDGSAGTTLAGPVARIGELTGDDGLPEFAAIAYGNIDQILVFSGGSQTWTTNSSYDADTIRFAKISGADLDGYELFTAGNVIPDSGAQFPDLVATGTFSRNPVHVISGTAIAAGGDFAFEDVALSSPDFDGGFAVPLGDIDGDSIDDLGVIAKQLTDRVNEDGTQTDHLVGQIFLGASLAGATSLTKPDLVIEPGVPLYTETQLTSFFFGSLGNVAGDAMDDFAIADTFTGSRLSIYVGRSLVDDSAPTGPPMVTDTYRYELARPLPLVPANPKRQINLNDPDVVTHAIAETAVIEGATINGHLGTPRSLGDINGDRENDFVIESDTAYYIFYGPQSFDGAERIIDRADLIVDRTASGTKLVNLAETLVNLDGDANGTNDLLFYRKSGTSLAFEIIYGSKLLPRNLNSVDLVTSDAAVVKHISFATTISAASNFKVFGVNWNGDSHGDIAAFTDSNSNSLPQLSIFSGALLADIPSIPYSWVIGDFYNPVSAPGSQAVNVGDFNGDGLDDIVVSSATQGWLIAGRSAFGGITKLSDAALQTFAATGTFANDRSVFALGDIGRAIQTGSAMTTSPLADGYDDFATVSDSNTGQFISIVLGSSQSGGAAQAVRQIVRTGSSLGLNVTLQPVAGDFDGDGKADLAVMETVGNSLSSPIAGTVYLFWDIANPARPSQLNLLLDADLTIASDSSSGIVNRISKDPNFDIDNDGLSDMLLGTSFADVVDGTLKIDAGRVYVIHGTPQQGVLPTQFDVLANQTISGSGDYVVDRATGQPAQFPRTLPTATNESWFRFTTLGDGLPGNYVGVSPYATDPYAIRADAAGTFFTSGGGGELFLSQRLEHAPGLGRFGWLGSVYWRARIRSVKRAAIA